MTDDIKKLEEAIKGFESDKIVSEYFHLVLEAAKRDLSRMKDDANFDPAKALDAVVTRITTQVHTAIEAYLTKTGADPFNHQLSIKHEPDGSVSYAVEAKSYRAADNRGVDVDQIANEIRRLNGSNDMGAGELAEKLMPFISREDTKVPALCHNVDFGTYANSVLVMSPWRELVTVDICMIPEIKWLWDQEIRTRECCCGHGKLPGYIAVTDEHRAAMDRLGYKPDPKAPHCYQTKSRTTPEDTKGDVEALAKAVRSKVLFEVANAGWEDAADYIAGQYILEVIKEAIATQQPEHETGE